LKAKRKSLLRLPSKNDVPTSAKTIFCVVLNDKAQSMKNPLG
jgi:hypothetical protein